VIAANGIDTVGIFRIAADKLDVAAFRKEVDDSCGIITRRITEPHLPACLLKEWLSEIRRPVIPIEFYGNIIENADNFEALEIITEKFPEAHKNTLYYLINFLQRIIENSEVNMMTFSNIAVVISPSLCRSPVPINPLIAIEQTKYECMFVCNLLRHLPVKPIYLI